jgi:hypothetical protein
MLGGRTQGIGCLKCCLSSVGAWLRVEDYVDSGKAAESLDDQRPYFAPVQPASPADQNARTSGAELASSYP